RRGQLSRAFPADKLTIAVFGKLTPVVHKEAPGTRELIRLTGYHPERELLVRQVSPRQLQRLRNVVRIKIDGARGLVHPARGNLRSRLRGQSRLPLRARGV